MSLRKLEQFFSGITCGQNTPVLSSREVVTAVEIYFIVFDCGFGWSYSDEELKSDLLL